jgi:hypothetical protein
MLEELGAVADHVVAEAQRVGARLEQPPQDLLPPYQRDASQVPAV